MGRGGIAMFLQRRAPLSINRFERGAEIDQGCGSIRLARERRHVQRREAILAYSINSHT